MRHLDFDWRAVQPKAPNEEWAEGSAILPQWEHMTRSSGIFNWDVPPFANAAASICRGSYTADLQPQVAKITSLRTRAKPPHPSVH